MALRYDGGRYSAARSALTQYRDCICVTFTVKFLGDNSDLRQWTYAMKIVRIASAIVVGTIVSTASNSAMAQAAGNPIPTPARAGFVCPKTIEGTTPGKGAEIRALLPSGNALDNPAQLRASIDELKRFWPVKHADYRSPDRSLLSSHRSGCFSFRRAKGHASSPIRQPDYSYRLQ